MPCAAGPMDLLVPHDASGFPFPTCPRVWNYIRGMDGAWAPKPDRSESGGARSAKRRGGLTPQQSRSRLGAASGSGLGSRRSSGLREAGDTAASPAGRVAKRPNRSESEQVRSKPRSAAASGSRGSDSNSDGGWAAAVPCSRGGAGAWGVVPVKGRGPAMHKGSPNAAATLRGGKGRREVGRPGSSGREAPGLGPGVSIPAVASRRAASPAPFCCCSQRRGGQASGDGGRGREEAIAAASCRRRDAHLRRGPAARLVPGSLRASCQTG